jgi:multiple sugar transport system permease protein
MAYLFIAPAVALLATFFYYPMLRSVYMSFFEWPLLGVPKFVGLANYAAMLRDSIARTAWRFTIYWTLVITPPIFAAGFTLAYLTSGRRRGMSLFRSIYFVPTVLNTVAAGVIWRWFFGSQANGLANFVLMSLGLTKQPIGWLGQVPLSIYCVVLMGTWLWVGLTMLLILGGLQAIPEELYEAAAIDGATGLRVLRFITLPLLRTTFGLALVISVIGSFLSFPEFLIMTEGGPRHLTTPILMWIYDNSFRYYRLGYGASLSVVLMLILIVLTWVQLRWFHRPTEY